MAKAEQSFKAPLRDGSFDGYMAGDDTPGDLWKRTKPTDTYPAITLKDNMRLGHPTFTSLAAGDLVPVYDTSANALKRVAVQSIAGFYGGLTYHGDAAIGTLSGDDEMSVYDTSAGAYRKVTAQSVADLYSEVGLSYHGDAAVGTLSAGDEFSVYDTSASAYKKVVAQSIANLYSEAGLTYHGDSAVGTLSGNDEMSVYDTSASAYKKVTVDSIAILVSLATTPTITTMCDIGSWNMDADQTKLVDPGLPDWTKIRNINVLIRNDLASAYFNLFKVNVGSGETQGMMQDMTSSGISLWRLTGGDFDSTTFNDSVANRGWIVIEYEL